MDEVSTEKCVKLSNEEFPTEKELEEELGNVLKEDDEISGSAEFATEWDEECGEEYISPINLLKASLVYGKRLTICVQCALLVLVSGYHKRPILLRPRTKTRRPQQDHHTWGPLSQGLWFSAITSGRFC
ncbi:hypothetical protein EMCRGX_G010256 [Ephydatia muelleri]